MPDGACVGRGAGEGSIHQQQDNTARPGRPREHPITTCQVRGSPSPGQARSAKCQEKSQEGTTKVHAALEPSWLMNQDVWLDSMILEVFSNLNDSMIL